MAGPLAFLPYALAAYGGYKGYKTSKDAGGSGLQRLLGTVTGATAGYYGGQAGLQAFAPQSAAAFQSLPFTQALQSKFASIPGFGKVQNTEIEMLKRTGQIPTSTPDPRTGGGITDFFNKALRRKRFENGVDTGEMEFSPGKVGAGVALLSYLSGAFENEPQDVYTPTYNLAVAELQKQRGGFKYIDPETGQEKVFAQPYIPEADPANKTDYQMGPYALAYNRFNTGGLAEIKKFNEGGINYLPSKRTHDEDDANNYVRASGYVEDGSGTGDKDEDTMLAQLADGEFVTRADGVLGAGIIAGANPNSMKDMREKGAQYFYEQQKRYKRVFDLLERSRNAKAEAKVN